MSEELEKFDEIVRDGIAGAYKPIECPHCNKEINITRSSKLVDGTVVYMEIDIQEGHQLQALTVAETMGAFAKALKQRARDFDLKVEVMLVESEIKDSKFRFGLKVLHVGFLKKQT